MLTATPLGSPRLWLILAAWLVPGLAAIVLWRRCPAGRRAAWLLVGACGLVIGADKLLDLQTRFYQLARDLLRGAVEQWLGSSARLPLRIGALGLGLALVLLGFGLITRRDRQMDRSKGLALGGIAWIAVYVAARLVPGVGSRLEPPVGWIAEGIGLLLVWSGVALGWRRGTRLG